MEPITQCRLCKQKDFVFILNLGIQSFTGFFKKERTFDIPKGPLKLIRCENCNLVQLDTDYDPKVLFNETYGYRSGLNQSMVKHLNDISESLIKHYPPKQNSLIVDIGSSDGTLLKKYPTNFQLLAVDPLINKFKIHYESPSSYIETKSEMFSKEVLNGKKASIITSIAMLYDLRDPQSFALDIANSLTDDGVWFFEQSYLPSMMAQLSYDTICHEHLTYYSLSQLKRLTDQAGLKIIDIKLTDTNGGSIAITAALRGSKYESCLAENALLQEESKLGLSTTIPYENFSRKVLLHSVELKSLLTKLRDEGKVVFGYGASTKGNVLLQYCGISAQQLPVIADVNPDKIGCLTPGTYILIIDEQAAHAMRPDYFLVLPWHFKQNITEREKAFLQNGGKLIFPLPHSPSLVQS